MECLDSRGDYKVFKGGYTMFRGSYEMFRGGTRCRSNRGLSTQ